MNKCRIYTILICGIPAIGKTYLSKKIVEFYKGNKVGVNCLHMSFDNITNINQDNYFKFKEMRDDFVNKYKMTINTAINKDESILIINDYSLSSISPSYLYEPYLTFTFVYPTDDASYVSFILKQNGMSVSTTECAIESEYVIKCKFSLSYKQLSEGEVEVYENYRACKDTTTKNTITKTKETYYCVYLIRPTIDMVTFDIQIQSPIVIGENVITIETESFYDLNTITDITVRKRTYKDEVVDIHYTKESEKFKILQKYIDVIIKQIGKEILSGKIDINPYNKKGRTPCKYCSYRSICGFNPQQENNTYNFVDDKSKDEIIEKMKNDIEKA